MAIPYFHHSFFLFIPMNFLALAKERYSLRQYSSRPVEPEKLDAILRAASLAPTGCNFQPQRILVATASEVLAKIRKCTAYQFNAPVTLVICYDKNSCWVNHEGEPNGPIDAAIVTTHMMLEAVEQGLGTCWVGSFDRAKLQQELDIPANYLPVALLPLGYAAPQAAPAPMHTNHKPYEDFTFQDHF